MRRRLVPPSAKVCWCSETRRMRSRESVPARDLVFTKVAGNVTSRMCSITQRRPTQAYVREPLLAIGSRCGPGHGRIASTHVVSMPHHARHSACSIIAVAGHHSLALREQVLAIGRPRGVRPFVMEHLYNPAASRALGLPGAGWLLPRHFNVVRRARMLECGRKMFAIALSCSTILVLLRFGGMPAGGHCFYSSLCAVFPPVLRSGKLVSFCC